MPCQIPSQKPETSVWMLPGSTYPHPISANAAATIKIKSIVFFIIAYLNLLASYHIMWIWKG